MEELSSVQKDFDVKQQNINEAYGKWKDSPYLQDLSEYKSKILALILENQRLWLGHPNAPDSSDYEEFKEKAIELVAKIYTNFIPFDLVSIQPMFGPTDNVFYNKFKYIPSTEEGKAGESTFELKNDEVRAKSRKLKTFWRIPVDTDYLSNEIRNEITREIWTDLRLNVGTVVSKKIEDLNYERLYVDLSNITGILSRKTLNHDGYWIMVGKNIGEILSKDTPYSYGDLICIGTAMNRWKVYTDASFPPNEILVGKFSDERVFDAYFYCPYIAISQCPIIESGDFCPRRGGIITRYAKKMISSNYYGKIVYQ